VQLHGLAEPGQDVESRGARGPCRDVIAELPRHQEGCRRRGGHDAGREVHGGSIASPRRAATWPVASPTFAGGAAGLSRTHQRAAAPGRTPSRAFGVTNITPSSSRFTSAAPDGGDQIGGGLLEGGEHPVEAGEILGSPRTSAVDWVR
jgi:hypothetical protein